MGKKINETEFMQKAREQFRQSRDALSKNRALEVEDLNFLNGDQWPRDIETDRIQDQRPCLTINKLPGFVDQVEGDQRQNRPAIKVNPVDSEADPEVAEILTAHVRNIEQTSQADVAYDTAFSSAVSCGEGWFRIITEYTADDAFEQDIKIKRIANPMTVYYDPMATEIDLSDGKYMFVTDWVSEEEFEKNWPNKSPIEFEKATEDTKDWVLKDRVRIAEYFVKEPITKTIWLTDADMVASSMMKDDNGEYLTREKLEADGVKILQERMVKTHKIVWYKVSGDSILEGPQDWPGRYFPIVAVWGKELNIEGKRILRGLIRHAKDPQRLYNYSRSHNAETVALAPKSPWVVTPAQIEGHEGQWDQAHKRNFPYLLANPDQDAPGWPQRQFPNQLNTAILSEIQIADQELHDTTGLQPASLGEKSNEKSGKAIIARQREGDVSVFAYIDNLARSLRYAGKVLVDLIPRIYTEERTIRLMGEDGNTSSVKVNSRRPVDPYKPGAARRIYDLRTGKYDVTVTVGPSYTTQREEAADSMMRFVQAFKDSAPIIGDLIAKNMDWPGAQEISERLQKLLPPGLADQETPQGGEPSPPGEPPLPPQAQAIQETAVEAQLEMAGVKIAQEKAKAEQEEEKLEQLRLETEQEKQKLEGLKLENKLKQAQIKNEQRQGTQDKKTDKGKSSGGSDNG